MPGVSLTRFFSFECPASLVFLMPCFEQILTASKFQSRLRNPCFEPWCTLWSSDGLCTSQISGLHSPDFPIWWPGVQSYLTHHSGSMLMSWLWDSYLEKIKCVHWGRTPSMWQWLQWTEAQRQNLWVSKWVLLLNHFEGIRLSLLIVWRMVHNF